MSKPRCYECGHPLTDINAVCPKCLPGFDESGTINYEAALRQKAEQRAEAAEARVAELEKVLRRAWPFVETHAGMVPTQSALNNVESCLREIRQALSAQPSQVAEAERAVVEAAGKWQNRTSRPWDNVEASDYDPDLIVLWDHCDDLAKLRKEGGDG